MTQVAAAVVPGSLAWMTPKMLERMTPEEISAGAPLDPIEFVRRGGPLVSNIFEPEPPLTPEQKVYARQVTLAYRRGLHIPR